MAAQDANKRCVICLSGGMDSTSLLLHMLASDYVVHALSFDYGQKHRIELDRLDQNLAYLRDHQRTVSHQRLDISFLKHLFHSALTDEQWNIPEGHYAEETMKQTVVPNRNAIFGAIAYGYALSLWLE